MVELRATDRFPSLAEAIEAVRVGARSGARALPGVAVERKAALDADNLQPGARVGADYDISLDSAKAAWPSSMLPAIS